MVLMASDRLIITCRSFWSSVACTRNSSSVSPSCRKCLLLINVHADILYSTPQKQAQALSALLGCLEADYKCSADIRVLCCTFACAAMGLRLPADTVGADASAKLEPAMKLLFCEERVPALIAVGATSPCRNCHPDLAMRKLCCRSRSAWS